MTGSAAASRSLPYRPHIDGLRAVAVLAVVVYHAFPGALPGGFVGVDVFFVISGFLISDILYDAFGARESRGLGVLGTFYARRIRRIFPALAIVLAACLIGGYLSLLPAEFSALCRHLAAGAGFWINFLLAARTGYFEAQSASNPLLHLWSLGVEEQFYLLWPLVVWLAARCGKTFLAAAVFLAAASYAWNAQTPPSAAAAAFFLPQNRLWELLIGAIAAAALRRWPSLSRTAQYGLVANGLSGLGLGLIGAGFGIISSRTALPNAWSLLPTLGAACVVCSGGSAWVNRRILAPRPMVAIGLVSYPLYLWHWPLLSFSQAVLEQPDTPLAKAGVLLAAGVLAWLTYALVEKPVRHRIKAARALPPLLGAMAALGGLALYGHRHGGFPNRFPKLVAELSDFNYDARAWQRPGFFLLEGHDYTEFADVAGTKPKLYLWGDSHAAMLYPGLEKRFGSKYAIVQRTAANLLPVPSLGDEAGSHIGVNRYVLSSIRKEQPACVVLGGNWPNYPWPQLEATVAALKDAGVPRIVVVGPEPQWNGSLPQQLFNYVRRHPSEPVPTHLRAGLKPAPAQIDGLMADLCRRLNVTYISPFSLLQDSGSFVVRLGETPESLVAFDYGHLTVAGSEYLVARFPDL